jgi:hypothetical protein
LNERNFGDYANKSKKDILNTLQKKYPTKAVEIGDNFTQWMDTTGCGFESNEELKERVKKVLDKIVEKH